MTSVREALDVVGQAVSLQVNCLLVLLPEQSGNRRLPRTGVQSIPGPSRLH